MLSSFTCQFGVFAAERLQARRTGGLFNLRRWGVVEWMYLTFAMGIAVAVSGDYQAKLMFEQQPMKMAAA